MPSFPSLADAVGDLVQAALRLSRDGLVRVDIGTKLDLVRLVEVIDPKAEYRIGLTTPYSRRELTRRKSVAADAKQITKWRNELPSKRRQWPVVILGRASGRDEAGLRRVPRVIDESEILGAYQRKGAAWLDEAAVPKAPARFFRALVDMAREGIVGLVALDKYCGKYFKLGAEAHLHAQQGLWELGLLPDPRAMDGTTPGVRLALNYATKELRGLPGRGALSGDHLPQPAD